MDIQRLSVTISEKEMIKILTGISLPQGFSLTRVSPADSGIELTVSSSRLGINANLLLELQGWNGSTVRFKVIGSNKVLWPYILKYFVGKVPGMTYMGYKILEADLKILLTSMIKDMEFSRISLGKKGISADIVNLSMKPGWSRLVSGG
jgi:hypothetical protein